MDDIMSNVLLRELASYDRSTGEFKWKDRPLHHFNSRRDWKIWNTKHSGSPILNPDKAGYLYMNLSGSRFPLHRLAWLSENNEYYGIQIDHINGNKSDNSIVNLRKATHTQNIRNQRLKKSNTSGFKGVHFSKQKGKWVSNIRHNTGRVHLGFFDSKIDAAKAYDNAAIIYHGEFAMTNKMMGLYNEN